MRPIARLLTGLLGVLALAAHASDDPAADSILARLKAARPDLHFGAPRKSALPGFYEIDLGRGQSLYASQDGRFFVQGEVLTLNGTEFVKVLTFAEQNLQEHRRELIAAVRPEDTFRFAPEHPKTTVTVFTDVDCGFCRHFHKEVPALNKLGIAVQYLAFPRAGLDSPSFRKIATAWCADNRQDALTRLKNGEDLPENVCPNNPVAAQYALGDEVGVNGTPALVLPDGTLVPGYRSAAELAQLLGMH